MYLIKFIFLIQTYIHLRLYRTKVIFHFHINEFKKRKEKQKTYHLLRNFILFTTIEKITYVKNILLILPHFQLTSITHKFLMNFFSICLL